VKGQVDHGQVVVNLTLARPGEHRTKDQVTGPLGSRLDLPQEWAGGDEADEDAAEQAFDETLRAKTGVPAEVEHRSKPEIGGTGSTELGRPGLSIGACWRMRTSAGRRVREQLRDGGWGMGGCRTRGG
jgi:hypothetical protein